MAVWAAWVRRDFVIDPTGEELLRMVVEADARYRQAAAVLNAHGLTLVDGRARPEVAIERDARAAIQRLIQQLDLAEDSADAKTQTTDRDRFPQRAS